MIPITDAPIDNLGNHISMGTEDKTFHARVGGDGDIIETVSGTAYPVILPTGTNCKGGIIQIQLPNPTSYDPDVGCVPFLWSDTEDGESFMWEARGKPFSMSRLGGEALGWVTCLFDDCKIAVNVVD